MHNYRNVTFFPPLEITMSVAAPLERRQPGVNARQETAGIYSLAFAGCWWVAFWKHNSPSDYVVKPIKISKPCLKERSHKEPTLRSK